MRLELAFRIIGGLILGAIGFSIGGIESLRFIGIDDLYREIALAALGLVLGLMTTPFFTLRPMIWITDRVRRLPVNELVAGTIGLLIGLILSALLAIPLSLLPADLGRVIPFLATIVLSYLSMTIIASRRDDLIGFLAGLRGGPKEAIGAQTREVLIDTSTIIDGRIADICSTGFFPGVVVIPHFVLNEVQRIADSPDALRRGRGRRGLEILNRLRREQKTGRDGGLGFRIIDTDDDSIDDVDGKLVLLARARSCPIVTNDFNLNRVAAVQGVRVLNVNELANAVKSVVLPGEEMHVLVLQEGKEVGQGIAYLDDGTMIVIEGGRRYLNEEVEVVVTRVLQTAAGRMVFGYPKEPSRP